MQPRQRRETVSPVLPRRVNFMEGILLGREGSRWRGLAVMGEFNPTMPTSKPLTASTDLTWARGLAVARARGDGRIQSDDAHIETAHRQHGSYLGARARGGAGSRWRGLAVIGEFSPTMPTPNPLTASPDLTWARGLAVARARGDGRIQSDDAHIETAHREPGSYLGARARGGAGSRWRGLAVMGEFSPTMPTSKPLTASPDLTWARGLAVARARGDGRIQSDDAHIETAHREPACPRNPAPPPPASGRLHFRTGAAIHDSAGDSTAAAGG